MAYKETFISHSFNFYCREATAQNRCLAFIFYNNLLFQSMVTQNRSSVTMEAVHSTIQFDKLTVPRVK